MLKGCVGCLNYPQEPEESQQHTRNVQVKNQRDLIDGEKQELLFRSVNMSTQSSPKRDKFFESRKFTGFLERMDSNAMLKSISNAEAIFDEPEEPEEENFQT